MSDRNPTKALPAASIPGINRIKPAHDREKLKHVKSPDVSKMPLKHHDAKMKCTYFFTTIEQKNKCIERLAQKPNHEPLKKGGRTSIL